MASLQDIPIKYYNCETDEYRLPDGRVILGQDVIDAKRAAQDQADAARGYNPYNHFGRVV